MPFLTLNGVSVPTRKGGSATSDQIGAQARSQSSRLLRDTRAIKRSWTFKTTQLSYAEGQSVIGMVNGAGTGFSYDDATATSESGVVATSAATGGSYYGLVGDDVDPQKLVYTAPATTANVTAVGRSLWMTEGASNLLSSDSADAENAPTGYVAVSGSPVYFAHSSNFWQGSKSLQVVAGAAESFRTNSTGVGTTPIGTTITGSCWLKGASGGESVTVKSQFRDAADNHLTEVPQTFTLAANEWRCCYVTAPSIHPSSSRSSIEIVSNGSHTILCDGFMLSANSLLVPWVDGGNSYSTVNPVYPGVFPSNTKVATLMCWTNGSDRANKSLAAGTVFGGDNGSTGNSFSGFLSSGTEYFRANYSSNGQYFETSGTTAVPFGSVCLVAVVIDTTNSIIKTYVNGVDSGSVSITKPMWSFDIISNIRTGNSLSGTNNLGGFLDQFMVVPYEVTASQLLSMYNSGTPQLAAIPNVVLSGDCVGSEEINCKGTITGVKHSSLTLDGTWVNNAIEVSFRLDEV